MTPFTWKARRYQRKLERRYPLLNGVTGIVMESGFSTITVVVDTTPTPKPGTVITMIYDPDTARRG